MAKTASMILRIQRLHVSHMPPPNCLVIDKSFNISGAQFSNLESDSNARPVHQHTTQH